MSTEITETLMGVGGFSLQLRAGTPSRVRRRLVDSIQTYDVATARRLPVLSGQIVVFPTRPTVPAFASALWAGQLLGNEGTHRFTGESIPCYLARANGVGVHTPTQVDWSAAVPIASVFAAILPANGITVGTIDTTGLSPAAASWKVGQSLREFIDTYCAAIGDAEWRIRPTGELDVAAPGGMFRAGEVVVTAAPGSASDKPRGLAGRVIEPKVSCLDVADRVLAAGQALGDQMVTAYDVAASGRGYGRDGVRGEFCAVVDAAGQTQAEVDFAAAGSLALRAAPRDSFGVEVDESSARQFIAPGDALYVFDPEQGAAQGEPVVVDSQNLQPIVARATSITWSPVPGKWGVFHYAAPAPDIEYGDQWFDITDWVVPAGGPATLRVSTGRGAIDWAAEPGTGARLGTTEVTL